MASAFFQAYCLDDQWALIANYTNSSNGDLFGEKAFAFADYTPCVADGGILSICYLLFILLASVRLGQLCSRSNRKGKVMNKGRMWYRFILTLIVWAIFAYQLLKDYLFGVSETNSSVPAYSSSGDVYMLQPMAPFQLVSRAMAVLGWGLALIVAAIETSIFTPFGNWMMTFLALMDLLCQFVKLYVVLTLYLSVPDAVAQRYVGNDLWVFVGQIAVTVFLALLPMCGRPRLSREFEISLQQERTQRGNLVQMEEPLLGESEEEAVEPPDAGPFPEYKTNIFSRVCFCWVCPILSKGKKHALQFSDIWRLDGGDLTDVAAVRFVLFELVSSICASIYVLCCSVHPH